MTFPKMLKKMLKNPRRKFKNEQLGMFAQTLFSIRFWLTSEDDMNDIQQRKKRFLEMVKSTSWEKE